MGKALYDIISRGAQYNVIFDPNHILMAKSIYQAEGLALSLYPQFKVSEGLDEFSKNICKKIMRHLKLQEKSPTPSGVKESCWKTFPNT